MLKTNERLMNILKKVENSAVISSSDLVNLEIIRKLACTPWFLRPRWGIVAVLVFVLCSFLKGEQFLQGEECFLEMPPDASKVFREPENCNICISVNQIEKVANISSTQFYENYAKPAKPVVVSDGAVNWPAIKLFDFNFFKKLYKTVDVDKNGKYSCQFFPYKTEFKSLSEVFDMKLERARLEPGERSWYIGWSNCNNEAGRTLQKYYEKPYFLSNNSENIALSWIFMGGPGYGAHMHVDNVHYPSWQAQLSGKKLWKLAPPPECLYKCKSQEIVVHPGEIIVIDTNRWYHQTIILPGEISITIGSEFD